MSVHEFHIVKRDEWHMPTLGANHDTRAYRDILEANVHHSDSTPPPDHADCAGVVLGFDYYHRQKGWAGIGYNRVVCSHGYVYEARPRTVVPAAAENHNTPILAYCLIAKGDARATPDQLRALVQMVQHDERQIGHSLTWTTHKEVEPPGYTACPGAGIETQIRLLRNGRTVEQVIKKDV